MDILHEMESKLELCSTKMNDDSLKLEEREKYFDAYMDLSQKIIDYKKQKSANNLKIFEIAATLLGPLVTLGLGVYNFRWSSKELAISRKWEEFDTPTGTAHKMLDRRMEPRIK